MRFTPPRRANRRMAGFVMPWMLSRSTCGQREGRVSAQNETWPQDVQNENNKNRK